MWLLALDTGNRVVLQGVVCGYGDTLIYCIANPVLSRAKRAAHCHLPLRPIPSLAVCLYITPLPPCVCVRVCICCRVSWMSLSVRSFSGSKRCRRTSRRWQPGTWRQRRQPRWVEWHDADEGTANGGGCLHALRSWLCCFTWQCSCGAVHSDDAADVVFFRPSPRTPSSLPPFNTGGPRSFGGHRLDARWRHQRHHFSQPVDSQQRRGLGVLSL